MTKRFGWTLVCPECYEKPGQYYGVLKIPSEAVNMQCPNCGTRLVDVDKLKGESIANQAHLDQTGGERGGR